MENPETYTVLSASKNSLQIKNSTSNTLTAISIAMGEHFNTQS
jgi:hypothetical protein